MRRPAVALTVVLASLIAAAPAAAWTGRCLPGNTGPRCHFWNARVTGVADGDTIDVDIAGDGSRRTYPVRFAGIQAMEQSVYSFKHPERRRGQCHAVAATNRLEQLIRQSHWRVRLAAQHTWAHAGHRLDRSVAVRYRGHWHDAGDLLMSEGHVLWMSSAVEWAWNTRYNIDQQAAMQRGHGLWNPTTCGAGPSQHVPIRLWVSWDPLGSDAAHVDGEWFKIENLSSTARLPLGRWWVRDSNLRRFTFPRGTVLRPGRTLTVRAGRGRRHRGTFYWGLPQPPFQNPGDYRHLGDGGYLFDPHGDLRASMVYPCAVACTDPNAGAVVARAHPKTPEHVSFHNVSGHPVDLYGYLMRTASGSTYDFPHGAVVNPGETLRLYVRGRRAHDRRLLRHWRLRGRILPDRGGAIRLQTFSDITLSCDSWGRGHC